MKITGSKRVELESELVERMGELRAKIKQEMIVAAEQGDFFRENFPFQDASERMQKNEDRIREINRILKFSGVAEDSASKIIQIGSKFSIVSNDFTKKLQLVNTIEADPKYGKISAESPIGQKTLGLKNNSTFELNGKKFRIKMT